MLLLLVCKQKCYRDFVSKLLCQTASKEGRNVTCNKFKFSNEIEMFNKKPCRKYYYYFKRHERDELTSLADTSHGEKERKKRKKVCLHVEQIFASISWRQCEWKMKERKKSSFQTLQMRHASLFRRLWNIKNNIFLV